MATQKYIKVNGTQVNHHLGSVSIQKSNSAPTQASFQIIIPYTDTLPVAGQKVEIFRRDDSKEFGGTIDEVMRAGMFESSDHLLLTINATGFDNRIYIRTTRDRVTKACAQFYSFAGIANVSGSNLVHVDGDHFSELLVGKVIKVAGVNHTVSTVTSPKLLTLSTAPSAGTGINWDYTVYSGTALKVLLDTFCEFEGFTYTSTSIQQGAAISRLIFNPPVPIAEAVKKLLELNPTFYFSIDPDQVCYFAVRTLVAAPHNITDSGAVWKRAISITETREDVRNAEISVVPIELVDWLPDTFTGDDVTSAWFTTDPIGAMVGIFLNGVEATVGEEAEATAGGKDFYYRLNDTAVWQDPLAPPLSTGDVLEVRTRKLGDNNVEYADDTARAARATVEGSGFGRYEEVIDRSTALSLTDAFTLAQNSVDLLKDNQVRGTLETTEPGYEVGQIFTLNVAKFKINMAVFIDAIEIVDEFAGVDESADIDFLYRLTIIDSTRRITSSDVLRSLFGGSGGIGSTTLISGGGGGSTGGGDSTSVTKDGVDITY